MKSKSKAIHLGTPMGMPSDAPKGTKPEVSYPSITMSGDHIPPSMGHGDYMMKLRHAKTIIEDKGGKPSYTHTMHVQSVTPMDEDTAEAPPIRPTGQSNMGESFDKAATKLLASKAVK